MSLGDAPSANPMPQCTEIRVYDGKQQFAEAAARLVVDEARQAVERSGRFSVALAGGSTPLATYALLAGAPFATQVPWMLSHIFWGDERCVDAREPGSNERMARQALLQHVPVPPGQVHPMRCGNAAEAREAAARYEELLRTTFAQAPGAPTGARAAGSGGPGDGAVAAGRSPGLDLVLLGIGDDGHTASLFPGSGALCEREHWVAECSRAGVRRVTLTAPFINLAGLVVFLVSGATKARVVKQVLEGADVSAAALPARLIRPAYGRLLWLLDQEAAALLTGALRNGGLA
jgi:6-phosphogluconolactonase